MVRLRILLHLFDDGLEFWNKSVSLWSWQMLPYRLRDIFDRSMLAQFLDQRPIRGMFQAQLAGNLPVQIEHRRNLFLR